MHNTRFLLRQEGVSGIREGGDSRAVTGNDRWGTQCRQTLSNSTKAGGEAPVPLFLLSPMKRNKRKTSVLLAVLRGLGHFVSRPVRNVYFPGVMRMKQTRAPWCGVGVVQLVLWWSGLPFRSTHLTPPSSPLASVWPGCLTAKACVGLRLKEWIFEALLIAVSGSACWLPTEFPDAFLFNIYSCEWEKSLPQCAGFIFQRTFVVVFSDYTVIAYLILYIQILKEDHNENKNYP